MKNLKITLLAVIVAISTSCSKQDAAEVKPASSTKTNELKEFTLDSMRTVRLADTLGEVRYQDTYYCSHKKRIETVGWKTPVGFTLKLKFQRPTENRTNLIFIRNKEKLQYGFAVMPGPFAYEFDNTDK